MLKNYIKIAWRNLKRNKSYTFINIGGIAIGLAACLLIILLILGQWRIDRFHSTADDVYRVVFYPGPDYSMQSSSGFATSPAPLAPLMKRTYSGIKTTVRMRAIDENFLKSAETQITNSGVYAEPSFFNIFDGFNLATGNSKTALNDPFSVVLTKPAARRLFGTKNPIGQTLRLAETGTFTVTGVLEKPAGPSHLKFDAIFSFSTLLTFKETPLDSWNNDTNIYTYILLEESVHPKQIEQQLASVDELFYPDTNIGKNALRLQPLTGIALSPIMAREIGEGLLPPAAIYILGGLALLIILIAGFNYANLSVVRSIRRAREVGVRRTIGAKKSQLVLQFLSEAMLMSLLALALSLMILRVVTPLFNAMPLFAAFDRTPIDLSLLAQLPVIGLFIGFSIIVGLLAGFYPAIVLSRFNPTRVLQGSSSTQLSPSRFILRKALMAGQFTFSLIFIVTTLLLFKQANYIQTADYGMTTENVLNINLQGASYQTVRNRLQSLPNVMSVAGLSFIPATGRRVKVSVNLLGADSLGGIQNEPSLLTIAATYSFVQNMGLSFVTGRMPERKPFAGGQTVILNEQAVKALGLETAQQATGRSLQIGGEGTFRIAGVIENFRAATVRREAIPAIIYPGEPNEFDYAMVLTRPGTSEQVGENLKSIWPTFGTGHPLQAVEYEAQVNENSAELTEGAKIIGSAALIAVLISCLGLLGMAAYQVKARQKEIGIRKVMGAKITDVVILLSKQFMMLVVFSIVVGLPIAYLVNSLWLQNFAYRIEIGFVTPLLTGVVILVMALATISSQTIRAALANPTDSLRSE